MIDPRLLMPSQKPPKGQGMRDIARLIMAQRPSVRPKTPNMQQIFDALSPADKMLVEDELRRGAPMWQTIHGSPPLPQEPVAPPLGVGIVPYSQIGGPSGRVGAPRQGGGDAPPPSQYFAPEQGGAPAMMPQDPSAAPMMREQYLRSGGEDAWSEFEAMQNDGDLRPQESSPTFFDQSGRMVPGQPDGVGTQVAPEPWQRRLNSLQSHIEELKGQIDGGRDWPELRKELQQYERERGLILQRYQPEGFQEASNAYPWREGKMDGSSFDDAKAYRVADSGQIMTDAAPVGGQVQPFGAGDDNVLSRQMANEEMGFRASASRLDNIDAMLRENEDLLDSLTFTGNMRRRALQLKDKFGFDLGENGEEYLTDTTVFRQNVLRNINRTIQEVTGAQMGEEEAKRIRAEMPDVDAGPVEFKAKLAAAMNMVRMDIARVNYWRQQGGEGDPGEVTDTELRNAMQKAGRQFYEQALSAGMSSSDARLEAARLLSEEFGI